VILKHIKKKKKWKPPSWYKLKLVDDGSFLEEKEAYRGDLMLKEAEYREPVYNGDGTKFDPMPDRSRYGAGGDLLKSNTNTHNAKNRSRSTADLEALATSNGFKGSTLAELINEEDEDEDGFLNNNDSGENGLKIRLNGADGSSSEDKSGKESTNNNDDKSKEKDMNNINNVNSNGNSNVNGNSNGNVNGNGNGNSNHNDNGDVSNVAKKDEKTWIKHTSTNDNNKHLRSQSSEVGKLDMNRFHHLTKISISLTNSQRVVLEDKRDLSLSYRKRKSQQTLQQVGNVAIADVLEKEQDHGNNEIEQGFD